MSEIQESMSMSEVALIVLGAVIGAAAGGVVKALIAYRQRLLNRRVAARAILGDLYLIELFLNWISDKESWPVGFEVDRSLAVWREFRADIAATVTATEWARIDSFYSAIHRLGVADKKHWSPTPDVLVRVRTLLCHVSPARELVLSCAARTAGEQREVAEAWEAAVADDKASLDAPQPRRIGFRGLGS